MLGWSHVFIFSTFFYVGLQLCLEEITNNGITVQWPTSFSENNIISNPLCYYDGKLVTRNCTDNKWEPPAAELQPCMMAENIYNLSGCPPGFNKISKNNDDLCYQIGKPREWNYPCLKSGGASVITDLSSEDTITLLQSLNARNISRYFWLPAKRQKFFNPIIWQIPGPKWGHTVESRNFLKTRFWILHACLLLDIKENVLITEACTEKYPSLCFYINELHYPAKCPEKYMSVRYLPDDGTCFGIEHSDTNLTFQDFVTKKCETPMGDRDSELTRFIFKNIAKFNNLPEDVWCWFTSLQRNVTSNTGNYFNSTNIFMTINSVGTVSLTNNEDEQSLPCMACQTAVTYPEAELNFEYSEEEKLIYLTIYHPSSLWKYNQYDRGIQCFSDGNGLVKVVHIDDYPVLEIKEILNFKNSDTDNIDKIVYAISLITQRSAQYWCEGHTKNFSLISTHKLVVNPLGEEVHVFSLVIKINIYTFDLLDKWESFNNEVASNIKIMFKAKKALVMDFLEYSEKHFMILLHLDVDIRNVYNDTGKNIKRTYDALLNIAQSELSKYNYTFINISSSMYCLPTKSYDNTTELNWELTSIGHIAAPEEFCLQKNGLPVKRLCSGSYLLGSIWGGVEGTCNQNYKPSYTTTFLYNFVKDLVPENDTSRFLIDGLSFVLNDVNIIIPADIYYLSMSLKHILNKADENLTKIDMGNIGNIAWAIDRVMLLDTSYLRLSQTLNSTNVILDSVGGIINRLAVKEAKVGNTQRNFLSSYQLAVRPRFILQVSYPHINNVSGIAVTRTSSDDSFISMEIKPLFINTTLEDVLSIDNLEVATWVPMNVLQTLKKINYNGSKEDTEMNEDIYIIISVFYSDVMFQELNVTYNVNSRIVGVALPPGFISNLEEPIPLIYRDLVSAGPNKHCGYWDFQMNSMDSSPGHWSNKGCYLRKTNNTLTVCQCYHLTHFGQLIDFNRAKNNSDAHSRHSIPLNIISLIGSFLSLLGIMGLWVTACVFQTWRKKASTKVLLHLSSSIAMPLLIMIIFNLNDTIFVEDNGVCTIKERSKIICITLGAALHYFVLSSFMWMLITAVLQFIRYVRVLGVYRPKRFMIKFTLIGWGTPLIPVIIVLVLDKENYLYRSPVYTNFKYAICYPSGFYFIVTVLVPICIILLINISLFILVMCAISKGPDGKMRSAEVDLLGAQLRLSIFLIFLLGLTWIFGIFSFSNNLIWSYLFCLSSTMQGFVLFVYFIICDSQTRNLWLTLVKPQFRTMSSRESVVSLSSN